MTIEEQAALYEAGVKAGYMGKVDWDSRFADALADHMELETLFADQGEEKGFRVMIQRYGDMFSFAEIGPEVTLQGYAAADAVWSMTLFERWNKAKRLAAQRPLIHNGRKMKR